MSNEFVESTPPPTSAAAGAGRGGGARSTSRRRGARSGQHNLYPDDLVSVRVSRRRTALALVTRTGWTSDDDASDEESLGPDEAEVTWCARAGRCASAARQHWHSPPLFWLPPFDFSFVSVYGMCICVCCVCMCVYIYCARRIDADDDDDEDDMLAIKPASSMRALDRALLPSDIVQRAEAPRGEGPFGTGGSDRAARVSRLRRH